MNGFGIVVVTVTVPALSSEPCTSKLATPTFSSSLAYLDALRRPRLPAALIQGLRDNFGAHTYQRVDKDGSFHTMWAEDQREVGA